VIDGSSGSQAAENEKPWITGTDVVEKAFEGEVVDARLIQSDRQARKIDPNIWLV
jgi:hypothetical protein